MSIKLNNKWREVTKIMVAVLIVLLALPVKSAAAESRLLLLGDSLSSGYGLSPDQVSLGTRLQQLLQARNQNNNQNDNQNWQVINSSIPGWTSADGLAAIDFILGNKPDLVIVALGANDILRSLPPEQLFINLAGILQYLSDQQVPAMLVGMLAPPNYGPEYTSAIVSGYQQLAERFSLPLYPFLLAGVAAEPQLNQADGIHPNSAGVEIIANQLAEFIVANLT